MDASGRSGRRHRVGHLDEAGDVRAVDVVEAAVLLAVTHAVPVDIGHDHAQAAVDLATLPGQAFAVLRHLQARSRHAPGIGGLARSVQDPGIEEDMHGLETRRHVGALGDALDAVLDEQARIRAVDLVLGRAGQGDVHRQAPGSFAGQVHEVELLGVLRHAHSLDGHVPACEHVANEVDQSVTGGRGADQAAAERQPLAGEDASLGANSGPLLASHHHLLLLGVGKQGRAARLEVGHVHDVPERMRLRQQFEHAVGPAQDRGLVDAVAGSGPEQGKVEHVRLDQLVQEMRPERDIGDQVVAHRGDLAQRRDAVDLAEAHRHAEPRIARATAARAERHHGAAGAGPVERADQAGDRHAIGSARAGITRLDDVDQPVGPNDPARADHRALGIDEVGHAGVRRDGQRSLQAAHLQRPALEQAVEGQEGGLVAIFARGEQIEREAGVVAHHLWKRAADEAVLPQVDLVHAPLRMAGDLAEAARRAQIGDVQRHRAGEVVVVAIFRARAQAGHESDDTGPHVDARAPAIRVYRQADTGGVRIEVASARGARQAHDQNGHLLALAEQAASLAVAQRLFAHGAGMDPAHGVEQLRQALAPRAAIGAEHAVVLAGEGVAVAVFEA
jgi:hypothetical protein